MTDLANLAVKKGDFYDYEWSFTTLGDRILDHSESVLFKLVVSNSTPGGEWASGGLDNIAITGGSLPGSGEGLVFSWLAETGRAYRFEKSSTLQAGNWEPASEAVIGKAGKMSAPVELETNPAFIRLETQ